MAHAEYVTLEGVSLVGDKPRIPFVKARRARGFTMRLRGLVGSDPRKAEPLLFEKCRSVHTFAMSFPIDVAFIADDIVVGSERRCLPGCLVFNRKAQEVVERPFGPDPWFEVGDRIVRTVM